MHPPLRSTGAPATSDREGSVVAGAPPLYAEARGYPHEQMGRLAHWQWPARFPLVQFPNPPLMVALLADLAARATSGTGHRWLLALFYSSLSVWAYEEARHGDNWFRRALGFGFAVYILLELSRSLRS